jgi:hypothetical protein
MHTVGNYHVVMAAELTDEQRKRKYELQTTWYNNLTAEQKVARNKRAVELQRIRRARWKEAGLTSAGKARVRVLRRSKPAPAVVTPAIPQKAVESAPARSAEPRSDRARRREYRQNLADYMLDCMTDPAAPLSGEWFQATRIVACTMGWFEKLNRIEATVDDKPDLLQEMRVSIALELLRRLAGERPTGAISLAIQ